MDGEILRLTPEGARVAFTERGIRLFWKNVKKVDSGCWQWIGAKSNYGYGRMYQSGKRPKAHRYAYELLVGPIPDGLVIDHLCRNKACVNPDHLEPVTNRENLVRGETWVAKKVAQTHCLHGHPFDEANTRRDKNGRRYCAACVPLKEVARKNGQSYAVGVSS